MRNISSNDISGGFAYAEEPHTDEGQQAVDDEQREAQVKAQITLAQQIEGQAEQRCGEGDPRRGPVIDAAAREYAEEEDAQQRTISI